MLWARAFVPAAARPGVLSERASAVPEGSGRLVRAPVRANVRTGRMRKEGDPPGASRTRPPARRSWSLAPRFGTCGGRPSPAANALSAFARTRLVPGRARPPPKPGDAPFRVGLRPAENPG